MIFKEISKPEIVKNDASARGLIFSIGLRKLKRVLTEQFKQTQEMIVPMIQALFRLLAQVRLIQFSDAIKRRSFCALRSGFLRNLMKIVLAERKAILVSSAASVAVKSMLKNPMLCLNFTSSTPERK